MNLYLRVLSYVKPYRLMVVLSLLSSVLFVLLNAFSIWMISSLISTIMNPGKGSAVISVQDSTLLNKLETLTQQLIGNGSQLDQLGQLCIILVISYILKNLFFYINNVSISFIQNRMIMDIRNQLFTHLQKLPLSFFDKSKSGELSSIIIKSKLYFRFNISLQNFFIFFASL